MGKEKPRTMADNFDLEAYRAGVGGYKCEDYEPAGESQARSAAFENQVRRMVDQGKAFGSEPIGGEAGIRKYVRDNVATPSDLRMEDHRRKRGG